MSNNLPVVVENAIYGVREHFTSLCGDPKVFEKEAGFAVQILSNNDYTLGVAKNNPQSVINAVTNIAAIGISLNPAKKQAYLVPRDGKVCLDISYMGLLDLAIASGSILWGQAELVYAADGFLLNGFDRPPTHTRNPFATDRGALIGVYVVVKTPDGDYLTTTMTIGEVEGIRDRSESWKKGQKGPWKTDPGEMTKKTCIKRAYKLWPKTDRLDKAVHYLNTEGGEGLEFTPAPPTWPQESFDKQFPRWSKAVSEGIKSAADILALARSKGALTPEQEAAINALKPPATPPAPAAPRGRPTEDPTFGDITDIIDPE